MIKQERICEPMSSIGIGIEPEPLGLVVKKVQFVVRRRMDEALKSFGLTAPQYAVLSSVANEPGLSNAALAHRCFVTPQTMNVIVLRLEKRQWLERTTGQDNEKLLKTYLTELGDQTFSAASLAVMEVEKRMVASFSDQEESRLRELLYMCLRALGSDG